MKDIDAIVIGNMDHFEGINYVDCWSVDGSGGTMKPVIKLTTGGTTGSTLAIGGYHMVASGLFDKVLVIGWEKNSESDTTGAITTAFDPIWDRLVFAGAISGLAAEAQAYMAQVRRHRPGRRAGYRCATGSTRCNNPHAQLRKEVTTGGGAGVAHAGGPDPPPRRVPPHRRGLRRYHGGRGHGGKDREEAGLDLGNGQPAHVHLPGRR